MSADTTSKSEPIIACNPYAISAEQRERWMLVGTQLFAVVLEARELPDGYAFRLPTDPEVLLLAAEDLSMERLCCPFLRFTLEIEPNGGPVWLRFTGGEGAKAFLRMGFESSNLLSKQVAQAAGLSITNRTALDSVETTMATIGAVNERFAQAVL